MLLSWCSSTRLVLLKKSYCMSTMLCSFLLLSQSCSCAAHYAEAAVLLLPAHLCAMMQGRNPGVHAVHWRERAPEKTLCLHINSPAPT